MKQFERISWMDEVPKPLGYFQSIPEPFLNEKDDPVYDIIFRMSIPENYFKPIPVNDFQDCIFNGSHFKYNCERCSYYDYCNEGKNALRAKAENRKIAMLSGYPFTTQSNELVMAIIDSATLPLLVFDGDDASKIRRHK